jgi:streptogramin lyase
MTIHADVRDYFEREAARHPAPPSLRSTALAEARELALGRRPRRGFDKPSFQWASGLVAALIAVAIVVGLLYSRTALKPPHSPATMTIGSATTSEYPIPTPANSLNIVTVGSDGNLFVGGVGQILKVTQSGTFTTYTIPAAANTVSGPTVRGIATGPDGNIWFTAFTEFSERQGLTTATVKEGKVFKMTTSGRFTEYAVPNGAYSWPEAITVGPDGNLWFTEPFTGMVAKMTTSGVLTEYAMPASAYDTPAARPLAITAGWDGKLWFTEPRKKMVANMTTSGQFAEFRLPSAGYEPTGIATGQDGNLWVTEVWSGVGPDLGGRVAKVTPSGTFTEYTVPNPNGFAYGITAGQDGNLWFIAGNNVARMTTAGVLTEYTIPASHGWPAQIATSKSVTSFYVWFFQYPGAFIGVLTPGRDPLCPSCYP